MMVDLATALLAALIGDDVRALFISPTAMLFAGTLGWVIIARHGGADEFDWVNLCTHLPDAKEYDPGAADRIGPFEMWFVPSS